MGGVAGLTLHLVSWENSYYLGHTISRSRENKDHPIIYTSISNQRRTFICTEEPIHLLGQPNLGLTHLCFLVFIFTRCTIHGLVGALPFVHPELWLFHNGSQLIQVLFDLFVVVNILAGNKQLNLSEYNTLVVCNSLPDRQQTRRHQATQVTCLKACRTSCLWLKCRKRSCRAPDTRGG